MLKQATETAETFELLGWRFLITLAGVVVTVFAAGRSVSFPVIVYTFLTLAVVSYALYSVFAEKASAEFDETEITYMMLAFGAAFYWNSSWQ